MAVTQSLEQNSPGTRVLTIVMTAQNDLFVFEPRRADSISIQCEGISASDIQVTISNNGVDYYNPAAGALAFAADGILAIAAADLGARYIKLVEATASESVTITVIIKGIEYTGR